MQCPACSHTWEPPVPLTKRQREVLNYVLYFMAAQGYAPRFQEIANHFGWTSLATVHEHLTNLERKNYLHRDFNLARAITAVGA